MELSAVIKFLKLKYELSLWRDWFHSHNMLDSEICAQCAQVQKQKQTVAPLFMAEYSCVNY